MLVDKAFTVGSMKISVFPTNELLGSAAALEAADFIVATLKRKGEINIILATANSQNTFFKALVKHNEVDWSKVNLFHMDEYIGLPVDHPSAFRNVLTKELVSKLAPAPKSFQTLPVNSQDLNRAATDMGDLLKKNPCDLCVMGIGENGHIAFNDPPFACFNDSKWVKVVRLDTKSRLQQVNEGHFKSLEDVPTHAMTITIPALLSASKIICLVPEKRKAEAVRDALIGPITEHCPASILRDHKDIHMYLDIESASLIHEIIGDNIL